MIKKNYSNVGIIPAAGKAARFGGVNKEMLPAHDGTPFICHAYNRLKRHCDVVFVVTNSEKINLHMSMLEDAVFVKQQNDNDLLGAIQSVLSVDMRVQRYFLTMPDTYMKESVFDLMPKRFLSLGMFSTDTPNRFGCLVDGRIYDKSNEVSAPASAWGVLSWDAIAKSILMSSPTLTDALNTMIEKYRYCTWGIGDYFDMATIQDYTKYIESGITPELVTE